jgi:hypothetical protein
MTKSTFLKHVLVVIGHFSLRKYDTRTCVYLASDRENNLFWLITNGSSLFFELLMNYLRLFLYKIITVIKFVPRVDIKIDFNPAAVDLSLSSTLLEYTCLNT